MNTRKISKMMMIPAVVGLVLSLSFCKKDTETVTEYGKNISGLVTYPDFTGAVTPAKGAVLSLRSGSSAAGSVVATTFADANGKYKFTNQVPGDYFITAKYNTENQNFKAINGINFATNPGYAISVADVDLSKDVALVAVATSSTLKISLDTVTNVGFRPVTWEIHSKIDFAFPDHAIGAELPGGFDIFTVDQFVFDAANPANTKISGYVLLSTINTFEPSRDALLDGGCVPKTLLVDVDSVNQIAFPETDTARFTTTSVEKYGDGYLAHGNLTAFYHTGPGFAPYKADTNYYKYSGGFKDLVATSIDQQYWNTRVTKPCDMYFVYQGKIPYSKNTDGSIKNYVFKFESEFSIYPQADYYISSAHFSESAIKINAHVQFQGMTNDTNYPD